MAENITSDFVYACITHVPLWVEFPDYVKRIYLGDSQGEGKLNLRDLAPQWVPYHPILGGIAGLFCLKQYILNHQPQIRRVGICQYRKFVTKNQIGVQAQNYHTMDTVSKLALHNIRLDELMLPSDEDYLLCKPGQFLFDGVSYDYLGQYNKAHHIEDLLRFTSEAVDLGVLDKDEVDLFFREKTCVAGGIELGFFPIAFWMKTITAIESVVWACVQRYKNHREGYQSRAWAFCSERLGSYFLIKHIREESAVRDIRPLFGNLNLITEDESGQYVPGI